jgi:hypothetical protein
MSHPDEQLTRYPKVLDWLRYFCAFVLYMRRDGRTTVAPCYNFSITGDQMTDLLDMLHHERSPLVRKLAGVDPAISALSGSAAPKAIKGKRTMTAAARARISAAQKNRWAKAKK